MRPRQVSPARMSSSSSTSRWQSAPAKARSNYERADRFFRAANRRTATAVILPGESPLGDGMVKDRPVGQQGKRSRVFNPVGLDSGLHEQPF
jgi:hypothetical protein